MKTITHRFKNQQQGAASLLTALVLLISITLVILLTSKEVLVETKVTADNYRASQATAAASAAMSQAEADFMAGGLDQRVNATGAAGADELVDYTSASPLSFNLTVGGQTTTAQLYFDNSDDNACDCQADASRSLDSDTDGDCFGTLGKNMTRALVTAKGWSDDGTAVRTITQCLGTFDIFDGGNGPKQPFISRASVGVFGNATIINRYTNSSIWTGGANDISGAAFATYLRPANTQTSDYTEAELNSEDEAANTQEVSNKKTGAGIDIITDDATLASKTPDQFFDMFFAVTKTQFMKVAENANQKLPNAAGVTSPNGMSGVIWVEGNLTLNATDVVGSPATPAVLVVNGDFSLSGGATVYGVIYVTGTLHITGNPVIKGTVIGESNTTSGGGGTLTLVYVPIVGDDQAPPFIVGTGMIIPGSWKDW